MTMSTNLENDPSPLTEPGVLQLVCEKTGRAFFFECDEVLREIIWLETNITTNNFNNPQLLQDYQNFGIDSFRLSVVDAGEIFRDPELRHELLIDAKTSWEGELYICIYSFKSSPLRGYEESLGSPIALEFALYISNLPPPPFGTDESLVIRILWEGIKSLGAHKTVMDLVTSYCVNALVLFKRLRLLTFSKYNLFEWIFLLIQMPFESDTTKYRPINQLEKWGFRNKYDEYVKKSYCREMEELTKVYSSFFWFWLFFYFIPQFVLFLDEKMREESEVGNELYLFYCKHFLPCDYKITKENCLIMSFPFHDDFFLLNV